MYFTRQHSLLIWAEIARIATRSRLDEARIATHLHSLRSFIHKVSDVEYRIDEGFVPNMRVSGGNARFPCGMSHRRGPVRLWASLDTHPVPPVTSA